VHGNPILASARRASSLGWGKPALIAKALSDHNSGGGVYVQDTNCHFSSTGLSNEKPGPPLKVTTPDLSARMKQRNDLALKETG
jgi:hypothetical protein